MRLPLFIAKFSRYEYWPWWLFYLPILPYWFYLALKNKSLAYFTAANPGIELGGFYGESKTEILDLIDKKYLPKAVAVDNSIDFISMLHQMKKLGLGYPVIAKPDVGERGNHVTLIHDQKELILYNVKSKTKYIIQEYIDYTIELGVLYSRMPDSQKGKVSSITLKEFLSVTGDGRSTIKELMQKSLRARFQIERLSKELENKMKIVLKEGEVKLLEPIGNHCRGTKFIDNNFLINEKLNAVFDKVCIPIKGFYYGRFDLKVKSIEDLYRGENIRIMELNGASSEPGHIYDPSLTLHKAYKDLVSHWKRLADISKGNMQLGVKPVSFLLIIKSYWKFVVLKKNK
ncbi:hypothetical protein CNR22_01910 [Sphingobacteriaceae bacterium]|nr:hypothetical protein CNR22_01910 [Sphingobacteriaceae bacterium]